MAYTLFDKIWNKHVVSRNAGFPDTLYIDVHLINKITSARAFEGYGNAISQFSDLDKRWF
jgi:3-isopropylmalate/(R)-2-methylmalate dehydratase large subunit